MILVVFRCSSGADAAEGEVNIVLRRDKIKKMNEGKLLGDTVWGDGAILCAADETMSLETQTLRPKFGELDPGTRA